MTFTEAKNGSMGKWDRGLEAWKKGYKEFRHWWDWEGLGSCALCSYADYSCGDCRFKTEKDKSYVCVYEYDVLLTWLRKNHKLPPMKLFMAMYNRVKEIQKD